MGWNGSDRKNTPMVEPAKVQTSHRFTKPLILIALATAIVSLCAVLILILGKGEKIERPDKTNKTARIADVAKAHTNVAVSVTPKKPVRMKTVRDLKTGELKQVPYVAPVINSNNVSYIGKPIEGNIVNPPRRLFQHRSLGMLAGIVNVKPGSVVVGIELPRNFDEDIKKAIAEEKIEITDEDTPEEAETKRMVKDMLEDCKKIISEGGSVREAVMEERNYLRKVGDIRMTLQKTISKMRREGADEADIQDAVTAANQMMKEYDGARIRISPFRTQKESVK